MFLISLLQQIHRKQMKQTRASPNIIKMLNCLKQLTGNTFAEDDVIYNYFLINFNGLDVITETDPFKRNIKHKHNVSSNNNDEHHSRQQTHQL